GRPLHQWAEKENPSFRRLAEVGARVARVLGELHARGVLHRDLKPEHILLRESDGEPVLLDFGVGWYEGAGTLTSTPLPPGTLHLRSPESLRFHYAQGGQSSRRYHGTRADDLYALGVCLYRAATGHYPFAPGGLADVLTWFIMHRAPHAPSDFNRRMPRALGEVIAKLLAKEPEERYPSGEALAEALEAAVASGGEAWAARLFAWEDEEKGLIRRPEPPTQPEKPPTPEPVELPSASKRVAPIRREPVRREVPVRAQALERRGWPWRRVGVAVLLGLGLCGVGVRSCRGRHPPGAESTPAAVALSATHSEDSSTVKTQKTSGKQDDKARKGLGTAVLLGCVGAACASAPQVVTKTPPPQECPPGAVQVMTERFGIPIGAQRLAVFDDGQSRPLAVQEGYTAVRVIVPMFDLPEDVRLSGELYFGGERVYARFTEARLPDGELVPVCMESWEEGKRGSEVMERGSDPRTVKIFSVVKVRAVDHFK
ncbi:MAG TPA: serine/threonine-protein kinase, partial [Myxococcaceae bacterium]|nr:serine/threonine-protein kinase [Myxococcaceae bacterium]